MFNDIDVFSGLMPGRTALTDPYRFSLIANKNPKTKEENIKAVIDFSKKYNMFLHSQKNVLLQLVSGFFGSRKVREKITTLKTKEEIDSLFYKKKK